MRSACHAEGVGGVECMRRPCSDWSRSQTLPSSNVGLVLFEQFLVFSLSCDQPKCRELYRS